MKSTSLSILLVAQLIVGMASAQSLVLRNGEIITGKKIRLVQDPHQVCLEVAGKTVCYPAEKVRGQFDIPIEPLKYLMPKSNPDDNTFEWAFMQHSIEGEITLGGINISGGTMSVPAGPYGGRMGIVGASSTACYGEKGDRYGTIYGQDAKKAAIGRIKAFTQDLPGFDLSADSLYKDWDFARINGLIKRYNLLKYTPAPSTSSNLTGIIVISLKSSPKATSVKILVDDAKEYELTVKNPVTLTIPDNSLVKVCASTSYATECELLRSARCCRQFVYIVQNDKKGKLKIDLPE